LGLGPWPGGGVIVLVMGLHAEGGRGGGREGGREGVVKTRASARSP
jgi:hypothetical protein